MTANLVVYGSFNCPYSYLASLRLGHLAEAGVARAEWRAVVHDPDVPDAGVPVDGELAEMFDRELAEIRDLLAPGEPYPARRPSVQPNTMAAVAGYCSLHGSPHGSLHGDLADRLRAELFDAFWAKGLDIGDRAVLDRLGCPNVAAPETMQTWQAEWSGFERRVVPMMVLPDGKVSRGLGALTRLADMQAQTRASPGGERR